MPLNAVEEYLLEQLSYDNYSVTMSGKIICEVEGLPLTFFSVAEARAKLEELTGHPYTRQAVTKAISNGRLGAHRIGELVVVSEEALIQYLEKWGKWKARR